MGHEPDRNDWLGKTLRHSSEAAPDACLDAETLAAWADGGLNAQAATAVEAHVSSCQRCMAILAAMERAAPAARARHAWTPARLFRWLVPITAAATAVALWVIVPDRPATVPVAAPVEDSQAASARSDADTSAQPVAPAPAPEMGSRRQNPTPTIQNAEPQAKVERELRDEFRERRLNEAIKPPAAAPSAGPSEQPPAPMASPATASDSLAGAATAKEAAQAQRFTLNESVAISESISSSNPLNRWRVVSSIAIERSTDGGKTWLKTVPLPGVTPSRSAGQGILNVRAVDDLRALVRTADGTAFYTVDGGMSWTRLQENSPAPF